MTAILDLIASPAESQHQYQTDFTAEEFRQRREAVYDAIGSNIAVIQGAEEVQGFIDFRQSNTFYYLSGLEVASAYMVLDGRSRTTTLYLPHRDTARDANAGPIIAYENDELVRQITGVGAVRPVEKMGPDLSQHLWWPPGTGAFHTTQPG